ncbi:hypothetical protein D8I24_1597 [Cupriavidus necator H850]|nr:hypothetical protein D8I24_1597 [Cupriavidus necator H850]
MFHFVSAFRILKSVYVSFAAVKSGGAGTNSAAILYDLPRAA